MSKPAGSGNCAPLTKGRVSVTTPRSAHHQTRASTHETMIQNGARQALRLGAHWYLVKRSAAVQHTRWPSYLYCSNAHSLRTVTDLVTRCRSGSGPLSLAWGRSVTRSWAVASWVLVHTSSLCPLYPFSARSSPSCALPKSFNRGPVLGRHIERGGRRSTVSKLATSTSVVHDFNRSNLPI